MKPLLHPRTKTALTQYVRQPAHALLLIGETGIGKRHVAIWLSAQLKTTPYIIASAQDKTGITIEQIRELYQTTRTGTPLTVVVEDAHTMSSEAQNAFLKLLEEPPQNTRFILTATTKSKILPTIRSRSQMIEVLPPKTADLQAFGENLGTFSQDELKGLIYTSRRLPGIFTTLLTTHEMLNSHQLITTEAKSFYTATHYQRHLICIEHNFDKIWIQSLLDTLALIIKSLLKHNQSPQQLNKLKQQAELVEQTAIHVLRINGNPKIHLARLCNEL